MKILEIFSQLAQPVGELEHPVHYVFFKDSS